MWRWPAAHVGASSRPDSHYLGRCTTLSQYRDTRKITICRLVNWSGHMHSAGPGSQPEATRAPSTNNGSCLGVSTAPDQIMCMPTIQECGSTVVVPKPCGDALV